MNYKMFVFLVAFVNQAIADDFADVKSLLNSLSNSYLQKCMIVATYFEKNNNQSGIPGSDELGRSLGKLVLSAQLAKFGGKREDLLLYNSTHTSDRDKFIDWLLVQPQSTKDEWLLTCGKRVSGNLGDR